MSIGIVLRIQNGPTGINQHTLFTEVPFVKRWARRQPGVDVVEWKRQTRALQQAALAALLRADQQIPRQLVAPALATSAIQAGGFQGAKRFFEQFAQALIFIRDVLLTLLSGFAVFASFGLLFTLSAPPAFINDEQTPRQTQRADAQ